MVKITNGQSVFEVSNGAFEDIYSKQGFSIMKNAPKEKVVKVEEPENELVEKPISKWTKNEVKQFALDNDIDISNTKNIDEAKELIKEFLGE